MAIVVAAADVTTPDPAPTGAVVTPDMIAVALGVAAPVSGSAQFQQWSMWITDALMLIEARLGDATLLDQTRLAYVVREAVAAHVRKPDDATQVDVAVDDARTSRRYSSGKGRVTILDEWWELLSPTVSAGRAYEVDTMPAGAGGAYGVDYLWVSTTQTGPVL